jgi:hypothetical protein
MNSKEKALYNTLMVIISDKSIREFLETNDPQALEQARAAVKKYDPPTLTVAGLSAKLSSLPLEAQACSVFVWLDDGTRLPVVGIDADPAFVEGRFIDLIVKEEV